MRKSNSEDIQQFLDGLMQTDPEKHDSLTTIREIVFNAHPDAEEKMMYGGIVFFMKGEMFGGVFASKNHVSLEFSKGFLMDDPNNHLEGKGKYRRHLKILKSQDVLNKEVDYYVKQAL